MKIELKNCFLEEDHEHKQPYLESYEWEDGTTSQLPACCINGDPGIDEFPATSKKLIEIKLTNELTQMVTGIYSSELIEIESGIFFISFYDVDEVPSDCCFIKGNVKKALFEYLKFTESLGIPFMHVIYAADKKMLGENLKYSWISASIFSSNPDLEGLKIKVKTTGLNSELNEIINNVDLDRAHADLWRRKMDKDNG